MNQSLIGYKDNIEKATLENTDYRRVLFTGKLQLVLMNLKPGEEIGEEIHEDHDQFFRFEGGKGKVVIDTENFIVEDGDSVVIPAGSRHNVINIGDVDLKLYTIYAPPEHKPGKVHHTKADEKNDPDYK